MRSGPFKGDWDGAGPFWFGGETSEGGEVLNLIRGVETIAGPHTMLCCTWHLNAQCAVWSAISTQCTANLEHSNALSTQCTRSNGHSALGATHL